MSEHRFGGQWTQDKLKRVADYLPAYTTIMKGNAYAKSHYRTIYIDAFADTGYRSERANARKQHTNSNLALFESAILEREAFMKGSAVKALECNPTFDRYIFVEKNQRHAKELENLKAQYPDKANDIEIVRGECNQVIRNLCLQTDWRRWRAVVFLDPYGMQVEWETIEAIARTRAIDMWLLFPLAQAVNRLLTKQAPPEKWANALDRIFGTKDWRSEFYADPHTGGLFGDEVIEGVETKNTDFKHIADFFIRRLNLVFTEVAPNPLSLVGPSNTPLYLLCFAANNDKAVKIAKYILGK